MLKGVHAVSECAAAIFSGRCEDQRLATSGPSWLAAAAIVGAMAKGAAAAQAFAQYELGTFVWTLWERVDVTGTDFVTEYSCSCAYIYIYIYICKWWGQMQP